MGNYLASREYLELESKREQLTQQYKELSEEATILKCKVARIDFEYDSEPDYKVQRVIWDEHEYYKYVMSNIEQKMNDIQSELTLNNAMLKRLQKHKENKQMVAPYIPTNDF